MSTAELGEIIGDRYRLAREIRRTQAGAIFEAKDVELQRDVAVEVAANLEDPKVRRKWLRDAMISQQLVGEHVLRVLDVGELGGVPFVVREVAVRTLADELAERGVIPIPEAVGWTLDACEAIAEAHAHGIAHGDVRAENVYLVRVGRGEPKVKVAWTSAAKAERAAREDVARDVAGLGAMLQELTTGRRAIGDEDDAPTLPDGLAHAVARALAEAHDGGFHGIAELARTLAPYSPPGHTAARNIARILSRAGIVSAAVGPAELPRQATTAPARQAGAFAFASIMILAVAVGGAWFLWDRGMLPRWTGATPPEPAVGTTELTSGSWAPSDHALDLANAAATDPAMNPAPGAVEPAAPREEEEAPAPLEEEAPSEP